MEDKVLRDIVSVRVDLVPPLQSLLVVDHYPVQLVAQGHPVRLHVVRSAKQFNLPRPRGESFNDAVYFVRFMTRGADLGHDDVTVEAAVEDEVALGSDQTVLLAVVQPVSCPSGADNSLELVRLHPDDFVHPLVTPEFKALSAELHGSPCHPQENEPVILKYFSFVELLMMNPLFSNFVIVTKNCKINIENIVNIKPLSKF